MHTDIFPPAHRSKHAGNEQLDLTIVIERLTFFEGIEQRFLNIVDIHVFAYRVGTPVSSMRAALQAAEPVLASRSGTRAERNA